MTMSEDAAASSAAGMAERMMAAAPAILALIEAAGRLVEERGRPGGWWWAIRGPEDTSPDECFGCAAARPWPGKTWGHVSDCPALALDAALNDFAALVPAPDEPDGSDG